MCFIYRLCELGKGEVGGTVQCTLPSLAIIAHESPIHYNVSTHKHVYS